eukprot:10353109-Heterocapsa_arctica.AAC.1
MNKRKAGRKFWTPQLRTRKVRPRQFQSAHHRELEIWNKLLAFRSRREPMTEPRNQMSARAMKDPASPTMNGLLRPRR